MTDTSGRPADWPGLLALLRHDPAVPVTAFARFLKTLQDRPPTDPNHVIALGRAADALCMALLLGQGAKMARGVSLLRPHAEAVASDADTLRNRPAAGQAVMATALAADLAGQGRWQDLIDPSLAALHRHRAEPSLSGRRTALASLAFGQTAGVFRILELPEDSPPDAQPKGPFTTPLAAERQIARVIAARAAMDLVRPAWRAWLGAFPAEHARADADWALLLFAARAVHCEIGGAAPAEVPKTLLADIEAL